MKKVILAILMALFSFYGCGTFGKITNSNSKEKISKKDTKIENDSIKETKETLPTETFLSYNLDDLQKAGDFEQKVSSGNGSGTTVKKKGKNLTLKTKTSGSKTERTNVSKNKEVFVYDAEYIISESKKIIKRIPLKYWLIFGFIISISYRKFISQILISIFPALGSTRLFSLFLGSNKK